MYGLKCNISRLRSNVSSLVSAHDSVIESLNECLRQIVRQTVKVCWCTTAADVSARRAVCFHVTQNLRFAEMDVYVGKSMSLSAIAFECVLQINVCIGVGKCVCACVHA